MKAQVIRILLAVISTASKPWTTAAHSGPYIDEPRSQSLTKTPGPTFSSNWVMEWGMNLYQGGVPEQEQESCDGVEVPPTYGSTDTCVPVPDYCCADLLVSDGVPTIQVCIFQLLSQGGECSGSLVQRISVEPGSNQTGVSLNGVDYISISCAGE
ncbi:hypothetical protein F5Y16DRAFT_221521 [Xylariaceae sp. FL0255]|nr:hypothetical protein F5Y16DRAFT_221521 [Xylariaceae sp. FL0255]